MLAAPYFMQADGRGYIQSTLELARMYKRGVRVRRSLEKALRLFEKVEKAGCTTGIVEMGLCARDGVGGERSLSKAAQLFAIATQKGDKETRLLLGLCFRREEGEPQSNTAGMDLFRYGLCRAYRMPPSSISSTVFPHLDFISVFYTFFGAVFDSSWTRRFLLLTRSPLKWSLFCLSIKERIS